jgi:hypothetical protein
MLLVGSLGDGGAAVAAFVLGSSALEPDDLVGRVNRYPAPAFGGKDDASASSALSRKRYPCPGTVAMAF